MDVAYDHIQEELAPAETSQTLSEQAHAGSNALRTEITDAYQAMSASPWGAKLGSLFGTVKKQSETYYQGARQELTIVGTEAAKGLSGFLSQTREPNLALDSSTEEKPVSAIDSQATKPESLPADIVKEGAAILSRLRTEATSRLKQLEKAEDAADVVIAKFGVNMLGFLKEAVTIAPPSANSSGTASDVLFESRDAEGRRVVHATRLDAQLHVIHTTAASFLGDPMSDDYAGWKENFDVDQKTDNIATDLARHEELRRVMEKLVPEQVSYSTFWARYYYLRHIVQAQEQRRRELLKETTLSEQEMVAWDDEEEDMEDKTTTPVIARSVMAESAMCQSNEDRPEPSKECKIDPKLKSSEPRRSNEHSVTDSDKSYDIVSGATSRTTGSPREAERRLERKITEDSEEEDWE